MMRGLALCLAFVLLGTAPAFALKISPFKASIQLTEEKPGQVFRVENNSAEPAAVQISIATWEMSEDGNEANRDAEDDFVIFPAQLVLAPHESRAVRVQYAGKTPPLAEKPYRLIAEQLPVHLKDTPGAAAAVRFMLKFKAALYVVPANTKPDIAVVSHRAAGKSLSLRLENRGTAHAIINDPALVLSLSGGRKVTMDTDMLAGLRGENVHAGAARVFTVTLPNDVQGGEVTAVDLRFTPAF